MKFSTRAGTLIEAIATARQVMVKSPALVAYTGVHLVVRGSELTATGSDGETTITASTVVTDTVDGALLLPPKPIAAFLATLPPETELTVVLDGAYEAVVTAAGESPYRFRALAETFPTPSALKVPAVTVDFRRLPMALAAVKSSSGEDKLVQVVSGEHGLHLHTTDQYRVTRAALPEAGLGPFSGLLRLGVLEQIARTDAHSVQVDPRGRVLVATGPRVSIVTRLVDEKFPAVSTALDAIPPYSTAVVAADLRSKLARLAAVTEANKALHVRVEGGQLHLSMDSVNLGSGSGEVPLTRPVTEMVAFGVNLHFLEESVRSHHAEELTLAWTEPLRPIFLSSVDPLSVTNVIMPVKL